MRRRSTTSWQRSTTGPTGRSASNLVIAADVPSTAGALVEVTPGGGIGASTFSNGTMSITNTGSAGDPSIASVAIDLRGSIIPDATFDPNGVAGDTTPKCLVISSGGVATGFVTPADHCNDPFTVPHEDEPGQPGFGHDVMTMDFTDFGAGETISFARRHRRDLHPGCRGCGRRRFGVGPRARRLAGHGHLR